MRRPLIVALSLVALSLSLLTAPSASSSVASGVASGASAGAASGASAARSVHRKRSGSFLKAGPMVFVGGQELRFTGRIKGVRKRKLRIETLTNRPGDTWNLREEVVARTDKRGAFSFRYPGPSNYGIKFRVRADNGRTSPTVLFKPRQQEIVVALDGGEAQQGGTVVSGETFVLDVDTTPTGRGELGRPAPPFGGRPLLLQQRVDVDQWRTVETAAAAADGSARFVLTAGAPGELAYRVVQDDVTAGVNEIGWFPSFPLEVDVVAPGTALPAGAPATAARTATTPPSSPKSPGATPLASQRYRWGPTQWDFAWVGGESLTSPPYRGAEIAGAWIDASDGSGRAAHYNGGLALASNVSERPGDGDHGSTSVTLEGNALTYGRWEFRRRIDVFEDAGPDYRVRIELVPERAQDAACGANSILVADVAFNSDTADLGVSSARAGRTWSGSPSIPRLSDGPHTFGVEVMRDHVTWFLDGRSLATVQNSKVAPGVPLTPRLSMVGRGDDEMRRTRVLYDWQRAWPINEQALRSEQGPELAGASLSSDC